MKPLSISLATPKERKKTISMVVSVICTVFLMITLGLNYRAYLSVKTENTIIKAGIERLKQDVHDLNKAIPENRLPSKAEIEKTAKKVAFVNTLIAKDIFPWVVVFDMLERAVPENVMLKGFFPEMGTDKTILRGRSKSVGDLTVFMKNLEAQGLFRGNLLDTLGVSVDDAGDDSLGIRFIMNGKLNIEKILQRGGLEANYICLEAFK